MIRILQNIQILYKSKHLILRRQIKDRQNLIDKFAKKALKVKSANILANVGISSFLLACALPKITFILRKKVTGSDAEPGLIK